MRSKYHSLTVPSPSGKKLYTRSISSVASLFTVGSAVSGTTRRPLLGPLPLATSASLVSVPNPDPCAYRLELSCASSVCVFEVYLVLPY